MRNFNITVNGKSYEVSVEEVGVSAPAAAAPAATPAAKAPAAPVVTGGTKVESPFPGLIKNILVENGTKVKKDQPILVLEAMKMDNDISAPCDGVVTVQVAKGSSVESGSILAVIS